MNKLLSKVLLFSFISQIFFVFSVIPVQSAGSATFTISPTSGTYLVNSTFEVTIRENSGSEQVNGVQARLNYDTSKLEFVSINTSGTAFPGGDPSLNVGGNGSVTVVGVTSTAVTGDKYVGKVTFKAKASSGSTTITFNTTGDNSAIIKVPEYSNILGSTNSATFSFSAPSTPPPPPTTTPPSKPPSSPPSTTKPPSSPPATTPPASPATPPPPAESPVVTPGTDTTAPKITGVSVSDISFRSATVSWTTDEEATSLVEFGGTSEYGLSHGNSEYTKSHKVTIPSTSLSPGLAYKFRVTSTDKAGNQGTATGNFKTKGYTVRIKIVDSDAGPVSNVKVTLVDSKETVVTDDDGYATFNDVYGAKQEIKVEFGGKVYSTTTIQVENDTESLEKGSPGIQDFEIKVAGLAAQKKTNQTIGIVLIVVGALALAGVFFFYVKKSSKSSSEIIS